MTNDITEHETWTVEYRQAENKIVLSANGDPLPGGTNVFEFPIDSFEGQQLTAALTTAAVKNGALAPKAQQAYDALANFIGG